MKSLFGHTFAVLIVVGLVLGPVGMVIKEPVLAAIGNAMFLAGFFTPKVILKYLPLKEAVFGGGWTATVLYFCTTGDVAWQWLFIAIPMLVASIGISKWCDVEFRIPESG